MFGFIFMCIVIVITVTIFYSKRESEEQNLILKMLGYYLLGLFYLNLFGIVIPLGFIISLLLNPRLNKKIKRGMAAFGLIVMILSPIIR